MEGNNSWIVWVLLLGVAALCLYLYFRFFKLLKIKSVVFVDGALGTGKSFFSVAVAVRIYKRNLRRYKIRRFVLGCFAGVSPRFKKRFQSLEEPRLYSNIRLRQIEFTKVTKDLLFRQKYRFAKGSVLLIDEFSLLADQFCYKDREMSERLSNFFKLFRHECGAGSCCVINSQTTSDLHYSVKYVLSDYLYIHHMTKYPFVCALKVQEMAFSADKDGGTVVQTVSGDLEDSLKVMLVFKKYFKYYDSYCYSIFTDDLPVYVNAEFNKRGAYIKDSNLVSFKTYFYLTENLKKEGNKDVSSPKA